MWCLEQVRCFAFLGYRRRGDLERAEPRRYDETRLRSCREMRRGVSGTREQSWCKQAAKACGGRQQGQNSENLKADIGQLKASEGVRQKHVKLGFVGLDD